MSFSSRSLVPTSSRLGSLGIFSIGVIAFALTTLQGCASPMVTASSAKEPGGPNTAVVGQIHADERTHVEPRYVSESRVAERAESRSHESRGSRHESCRRCSN
jgi:hypothetical protein